MACSLWRVRKEFVVRGSEFVVRGARLGRQRVVHGLRRLARGGARRRSATFPLRPCSRATFASIEADRLPIFLAGWGHELADGGEETGNRLVAAPDSPLQLIELRGQLPRCPEGFPKPDESAHDEHAHLARSELRTLAAMIAPCSVNASGRCGENRSLAR